MKINHLFVLVLLRWVFYDRNPEVPTVSLNLFHMATRRTEQPRIIIQFANDCFIAVLLSFSSLAIGLFYSFIVTIYFRSSSLVTLPDCIDYSK